MNIILWICINLIFGVIFVVVCEYLTGAICPREENLEKNDKIFKRLCLFSFVLVAYSTLFLVDVSLLITKDYEKKIDNLTEQVDSLKTVYNQKNIFEDEKEIY